MQANNKHEVCALLALCIGNPQVTSQFPVQGASNVENLFMSWCRYDTYKATEVSEVYFIIASAHYEFVLWDTLIALPFKLLCVTDGGWRNRMKQNNYKDKGNFDVSLQSDRKWVGWKLMDQCLVCNLR